jgi:hypothetical protein
MAPRRAGISVEKKQHVVSQLVFYRLKYNFEVRPY